MAKQIFTYVLIGCFSIIGSPVFGCPTCIARNEQYSPPFFTEEFYNSGDNKALFEDNHYTKK